MIVYYIIGLSLVMGMLWSGLFFAVWRFRDMRKSWLIWANEDAGRLHIERRRITKDTITKRKDKRVYFLNGKARRGTDRGSAWILDDVTGANLVPPNYTAAQRLAARQAYQDALRDAKDQGERDPAGYAAKAMGTILHVFAICTPGFAYNKLRNDSYGKWRRTQEGKPDWKEKMVLPAMLLGICAIGALAYVMIRMSG